MNVARYTSERLEDLCKMNECGKVYIGETGRPMQDRIKEHDRDIRLARTETSAVSEHAHNTGHKPLWNEVKPLWNEVKYIDRSTTGEPCDSGPPREQITDQQGSKCTNQSC